MGEGGEREREKEKQKYVLFYICNIEQNDIIVLITVYLF